MRRVDRRATLALAPAIAAVALVGASTAGARVPVLHGPPKHHALSRARVRADAGLLSRRVVVVLRNQHHAVSAAAGSVRTRAKLEARDRAPLERQIRRTGGRVHLRFRALNAFAATVSPAERTRLAANPAVASVVPDTVVTLPRRDQAGLPAAAAAPAPVPARTVCPTNPAAPLLEPEALQTTRTAFADPSVPQAQSLATGKGVKVAFFADGLDIDNPDFIRPDGSHVFVDYRDFSGDGPNAQTGGAEAFGDASSIAAQGRQIYDLADYVNPAHPLPPGCTIRVRGMAPGASLVGMKVFGNVGSAFSSTIVQGMDWAVAVDHVDILSESFGGYPIPDTTADLIRQVNDQAVAAGITVSQGSGDSGAQASPSPPAPDPLVIDSGANTNFRAYAQGTAYGFQFSNGSYLSDNISSIGGGGFSQDALPVDLVAPGESDWALCSPDLATYTECFDFKGAGTGLQQFGGTSQATPLTAGAAALVIEAYRSTHGGRTPSPALVKQILTSTANDLGLPSQEQGAGQLDALEAVREARSINGGTPTGPSLRIGPNQVRLTGPAGTTPADTSVSVTNTGAGAQTVSAHARHVAARISDQSATVQLGPTSPTFVDQFGSARPYARTTFTVPAGADRLVEYDTWPGPMARVGVALIDPTGAYAAYTRPQGDGNHGQVDVRKPVAGTWTAITFIRDGTFTGPVHLEFTAERYGSVDAVSPASLTLAPGQTGRFRVHASLPSTPGDSAHDLVLDSSTGDSNVVPIVLRSLVPLGRRGGDFSGTIIGGNGRPGPAQQNTFAFDVPRGEPELTARLRFPDDAGTEVQAYLIDPGGNALAAASTVYLGGGASDEPQFGHALQAYRVDPRPGRWKLVVNVTNPVGGNAQSAPLRGHIGFDPPDVTVRGLPNSGAVRLRAGQPVRATVRVRNTGPAPEDVFVDPRLARQADLPLLALTQPTGVTLPIPGDELPPAFLVPTQTRALVAAAEASAPIVFELGFGPGDPDVRGFSVGNRAVATYSAPEVAQGVWFLTPSLRGPFTAPASGTVNTGMLARTAAFDADVRSSTGDIWRQTVDPEAPDYTPLTLGPGERGTIRVRLIPRGPSGSVVSGVLYLDDFSNWLLAGNEQLAIPYRYRIR